MSDSLQEQLRALGLAQDKPKRERQTGKRRKSSKAKRRPSKGPATAGSGEELTLDEAYALREREERRQQARAREAKLAEERRRREINGKIRAIVKAGRLNRDDAELPRNFLFRGRIRKIYVTADQQRALAAGEAGIVYLSGGYHLLPAESLDQIRRISSEHIVDLPAGDGDEDEHPVPDDLTW
jgi:uncharacterized protein YaiL (DUF2058 family)